METEIFYKTTKEACQLRIDSLNHVCEGCGGIITAVETVDNSGAPTYWSACMANCCQKFTSGVPLEIHQIAKHMVTQQNYTRYSSIERPKETDTPEYRAYYTASQIAGASDLVRDVLRTQKIIQVAKWDMV